MVHIRPDIKKSLSFWNTDRLCFKAERTFYTILANYSLESNGLLGKNHTFSTEIVEFCIINKIDGAKGSKLSIHSIQLLDRYVT